MEGDAVNREPHARRWPRQERYVMVEPIMIEFKYPWTMMPLENAGEWIEMVKDSLQPSDPLFGKDIFVSGRHESNRLLLVDNDTDDNYAIVSIQMDF